MLIFSPLFPSLSVNGARVCSYVRKWQWSCAKLSWAELSWTELNWTKLNWTMPFERSWFSVYDSRAELKWSQNWKFSDFLFDFFCGLPRTWSPVLSPRWSFRYGSSTSAAAGDSDQSGGQASFRPSCHPSSAILLHLLLSHEHALQHPSVWPGWQRGIPGDIWVHMPPQHMYGQEESDGCTFTPSWWEKHSWLPIDCHLSANLTASGGSDCCQKNIVGSPNPLR